LTALNRSYGIQKGHLNAAQSALKYFEGALKQATSASVTDEERECPICMDDMADEDMAITACGHVFHFKCGLDSIRAQKKCPTCRHDLAERQISPCATLMKGAQEEDPEKTKFGSKIVAIRDVLRKIHAESDEQSIVFIQFASIFDSMRKALEKVGIKAFTLGGSVASRTQTIDAFKQTPKSVLLLSLEQDVSGMNLVNANHCLLVHPLFSDSTEEASRFETQAIGRICRQGQTKRCFIYRFVTKGTIEEDILRKHHSELLPDELAASGGAS
jgi:SWI/SNF-related matrix-associated actin-dependent regulator of chromatin subfamily A3